MNENKRSGNLVLILMASMLVLALVFMAAFFFSREPGEITGTPTPSPTKEAVASQTPVPTNEPENTPTVTPPQEADVTVSEQDMIAPVVTTKRVVITYGTEVAVEDFIFSIE